MNPVCTTLFTAVLAALVSAPAWAENCADTTFATLSSIACEGSFVGNINGSASEITAIDGFFGASFTYAGKSDDPSFGPFTSNPTVSVGGTLTFDAPISGEFVIGLKAADNFSYYLFDALSPISSLTFSSTAGIAENKRGIPQDLSHAALYVTAVPEPETYALMIVGLGLLGWTARRRRV
jgi:hypothetical protein